MYEPGPGGHRHVAGGIDRADCREVLARPRDAARHENQPHRAESRRDEEAPQFDVARTGCEFMPFIRLMTSIRMLRISRSSDERQQISFFGNEVPSHRLHQILERLVPAVAFLKVGLDLLKHNLNVVVFLDSPFDKIRGLAVLSSE